MVDLAAKQLSAHVDHQPPTTADEEQKLPNEQEIGSIAALVQSAAQLPDFGALSSLHPYANRHPLFLAVMDLIKPEYKATSVQRWHIPGYEASANFRQVWCKGWHCVPQSVLTSTHTRSRRSSGLLKCSPGTIATIMGFLRPQEVLASYAISLTWLCHIQRLQTWRSAAKPLNSLSSLRLTIKRDMDGICTPPDSPPPQTFRRYEPGSPQIDHYW